LVPTSEAGKTEKPTDSSEQEMTDASQLQDEKTLLNESETQLEVKYIHLDDN
jgi:hypothetical protein